MKRLAAVAVFGCVFLMSGLVLADDKQERRGGKVGGKPEMRQRDSSSPGRARMPERRGGVIDRERILAPQRDRSLNVESMPGHRGGAPARERPAVPERTRERVPVVPDKNRERPHAPERDRAQRPGSDGGKENDLQPVPMPRQRSEASHLGYVERRRCHYRSYYEWRRMGWGFNVGIGGLDFYYGPMVDGCYPYYYPRAVFYPRVWVVGECYSYWYGCPLYPNGCPIHGYHHRRGYCEWYYDEFGGMEFRYYPVRPGIELELELEIRN